MTLMLIYNNQTEVMEFMDLFNEYCSLFDEVCKIIKEKFNLNNLLNDHQLTYYDYPYNSWINFNVHVTKRVTEVIRHSVLKTLKIRIERCRTNNIRAFVEKMTVNKEEPKLTEDNRCAHMVLWLDEHIGHPLWHKQLKRDCQAMINTNISFIANDNIDRLIQYNSSKCSMDPFWRTHSTYFIENTSNYSCPFQCALFTVDNTDKFFEYLNMTLKLTHSLSVIVSEYFAKQILPTVFSRQQEKLIPNDLFVYVLCSNITNYYDWATGYFENGCLSPTNHLEFFDDEKSLFVRLLKDISNHLTLKADDSREQKHNWHALQYYSAARQLFLNSLPWDSCYTLRKLDNLDQRIEESERDAIESVLNTYRSYTINDNDKLGHQCTEIM